MPKTVPGTAPAASLPAELPRGGFFVADIFDALPKDDLGSMEHPMFSLSTRPDLRILAYAHNGVEITVTPSIRGLATIHDKDILIFCVSQLMAAINAGRPVSRNLRLKAADLMAATGREASGDGYQRLREAFERLAGTRITTNIVTGETEIIRPPLVCRTICQASIMPKPVVVSVSPVTMLVVIRVPASRSKASRSRW